MFNDPKADRKPEPRSARPARTTTAKPARPDTTKISMDDKDGLAKLLSGLGRVTVKD
jgi:hypothetical protein